jgi:hypothetical protein
MERNKEIDRKLILAVILILIAVLQNGCLNYSEAKDVPPGFKYLELGATHVFEDIISLRLLAGKVVDRIGEPIDDVLVEIKPSPRGERLYAVFTDSHGMFQFGPMKEDKYYIRFTKPDMAPLEGFIKITKSGKKSHIFVMDIGF